MTKMSAVKEKNKNILSIRSFHSVSVVMKKPNPMTKISAVKEKNKNILSIRSFHLVLVVMKKGNPIRN